MNLCKFMLPEKAALYVSEKINNTSLTLGTSHKFRLHFSDGAGSIGTILVLRKDIGVEGGSKNCNSPLLYVCNKIVLTLVVVTSFMDDPYLEYVKSVIKLTSWANFMSKC